MEPVLIINPGNPLKPVPSIPDGPWMARVREDQIGVLHGRRLPHPRLETSRQSLGKRNVVPPITFLVPDSDLWRGRELKIIPLQRQQLSPTQPRVVCGARKWQPPRSFRRVVAHPSFALRCGLAPFSPAGRPSVNCGIPLRNGVQDCRELLDRNRSGLRLARLLQCELWHVG